MVGGEAREADQAGELHPLLVRVAAAAAVLEVVGRASYRGRELAGEIVLVESVFVGELLEGGGLVLHVEVLVADGESFFDARLLGSGSHPSAEPAK